MHVYIRSPNSLAESTKMHTQKIIIISMQSHQRSVYYFQAVPVTDADIND